jgi:hypothetical protein
MLEGQIDNLFLYQSDCKLLLYADDSTIMFSHKDPESISEGLGKELDSCSERLIDNKLSTWYGHFYVFQQIDNLFLYT